jgi:hypothetical protein
MKLPWERAMPVTAGIDRLEMDNPNILVEKIFPF